jgi:hypothetical protein
MRGGYSGTTSFEYEVERYRHKQSGELVSSKEVEDKAHDNPMLGDDWIELNYDYEVVTLQIEGRAYFTPGKYSGLPEDCYPDEGDVEITSCIGPDGSDWENKLTKYENDQIINQIDEQVQEGDYSEPDDYDDFDYGGFGD